MRERAFILTLLACLSSVPASAQGYPTKPVTWVVPTPAGNISDNQARMLAKLVAEKLGQPVVVENKPGASGIIAADYVAQAKADGYTLMYGHIGTLAINKYLYRRLSYDPLTSFTPIHGIGAAPMLLVVPETSSYRSVKDLVEAARRNPDKMNYASPGAGSAQHLVAALLAKAANVSVTHIPYKGTVAAVSDMLGGNIDFLFDFSPVLKPQIEAGKLRALASTGDGRLKNHEDVPTFAELGYPAVQLTAWSVLVGPAGMPQSVVDKLATVVRATLQSPQSIEFHAEMGSTILPDLGPKQSAEFIEAEQRKLKELVSITGATAD
jgi:tripartite-type tricarboxylate transporter receptor subunit TctC